MKIVNYEYIRTVDTNLSQFGRSTLSPNRAKAQMVTMEELVQFYQELRGADYQAWRARFNIIETGEESYPNELYDQALTILRQRNADLRRGDFIFYEFEFDVDYRNDGKAMFNGRQVIDLASEPDDYGTIPVEFQIGEFSPLYWMDLIDHNTLIPFNVVERLPGLTTANVRVLSRRDRQGSHMIIPFFAANGQTYAIADAQMIDPNDIVEETAQEFLDAVLSKDYFNFYNSLYQKDFLMKTFYCSTMNPKKGIFQSCDWKILD